MKTVFGMVKINLRQSTTVYETIIPIMILSIINYILFVTINASQDNSTVAVGNFLYLLPFLLAIFVPIENFTKLMNLGGNRKDFFKSNIILYVLVVVIVTAISMVFYFTIDRILFSNTESIMDLFDIFGFMKHGIIIAFFQMCAFLTLVSCVAHTLTLIQGHWYGWVADVIIITIISVFTPIASLRATLIWFFNMIIFHDIAIVQILSCVVLSVIIYCLSLIPIRSKVI